ncbi:hypothetical protein BG011_002694 [Mortierella polycephala]|uniref:G-protein coupled receptors family 2 profile 2 domain-containing protein n=1 Tax=Mortierella polycephala TaxID=41804 RepID=A0A9P6UA98_9FUNG|nr:hypothetical protein BG011_002694 [Mortierella polycephala]
MHQDDPSPAKGARSKLTVVMTANWLSMVGSLLIIIHIPRVIQQAPAQTKRMIIILFTAISNLGFSLANIVTDFTEANTFLPCTVSAWCYSFFQLLTCTLVIIGTFRLCGVFLFERRRSIPSKYILISPALSFTLATIPAAAGQFGFDECAHYCWFVVHGYRPDCRGRSAWAWFGYYVWMILFLAILLGSTLFVMVRIALSVMHSRWDLKEVANQSLESIVVEPQPVEHHPTVQGMSSMSHSNQNREPSLFSTGNLPHGSPGSFQRLQERTLGEHATNPHLQRDQHQHQDTQTTASASRVPVIFTDSSKLDSPTLRKEGILAPPLSNTEPSQPRSQVQSANATGAQINTSENAAVMYARRKPFLVAILRQALYPISISISGCVQIIVDLTLMDANDYTKTLDYGANVSTSIQGFLFFLVFMFDPAVVQTRRHWRKYMAWKYYIEFYYSLGMPHEGRDFQDRFMQQCMACDWSGKDTKSDQLTKPPPYSWSLQYDNLAMPSDFQTTYPLANVCSPNAFPASPAASFRTMEGERSGDGAENRRRVLSDAVQEENDSRVASVPSTPIDPDRLPAEFSVIKQHDEGATRTDYTQSNSDPSSTAAQSTYFSDRDDTKIHPMDKPLVKTTGPIDSAQPTQPLQVSTNTIAPHIVFDQDVDGAREEATVEAGMKRMQEPEVDTNTNPSQQLSVPQTDVQEDIAATSSTEPLHNHIDNDDRKEQLRAKWRRRRKRDFLGDDVLDRDLDSVSSDSGISSRDTSPGAYHPGDTLNLHRLSKIKTIGGGDGVARRHRAPIAYKSDPSKSPSGQTTSSAVDRSNSKRPSIKDRVWFRNYGVRWNMRANPYKEKYQTQFRFPRCAYWTHMLVRQLIIPQQARLPPIPNPFNRKKRVNTAQERELNQQAVLDAVEVMDSPHGRNHQAAPFEQLAPPFGTEIDCTTARSNEREGGPSNNAMEDARLDV